MTSGHQGTLLFLNGCWHFEDRSSTNGTWLRGSRVSHAEIEGPTQLALGGIDGPILQLHPHPQLIGSPPPHLSSASEVDGTTTPWWRRESQPIVVQSLTIGRALDADHPIADMLVSRTHARLDLLDDGSARIVDLNSVNGTYVDGVAASPSLLVTAGQRVGIGNTTLTFDGAQLVASSIALETMFSVDALTTTVATKTGPKELLSNTTFALPRGTLMAVLGPSGAGKSTLLGAITGTRPATSGSVRFNGLDLYRNFGEVRHRMGFVPQEDILHPLLTIRTALRHAARLRFPTDTSQAERDTRIDVVLAQLHLSEHAEKQIANLSGGQRKRVNVALELLSEPDLLILDEPTSGLDPGNERSVMEQLRALADAGRTVIVVSHSTESLHLCDQVLMLAPGGVTAFHGPVSSALGFFNSADYPRAFQLLDGEDPEQLRRAYLASEFALAAQRTSAPEVAAGPVRSAVHTSDRAWAVVHFRTFVARYVDVMRGDRRALAILALQAPIMAVLMLAVFGHDRLRPGPYSNKAGNVLVALVLATIYMGASTSLP